MRPGIPARFVLLDWTLGVSLIPGLLLRPRTYLFVSEDETEDEEATERAYWNPIHEGGQAGHRVVVRIAPDCPSDIGNTESLEARICSDNSSDDRGIGSEHIRRMFPAYLTLSIRGVADSDCKNAETLMAAPFCPYNGTLWLPAFLIDYSVALAGRV